MGKTCVYLRVSTVLQNTDNQLIAIQTYAQQNNFEISHIYKDDGVSGMKD